MTTKGLLRLAAALTMALLPFLTGCRTIGTIGTMEKQNSDMFQRKHGKNIINEKYPRKLSRRAKNTIITARYVAPD